MSDEPKGGAPKKLSTQEILAAARASKAVGGAAASTAPAVAPEAPAPTEPAPPKPIAGAKPKSTAEIMAAARAQKAGATAGDSSASPAAKSVPAKPAASTAGAGGKPKSTADILAAARAGSKAGGAALSAVPAVEKPAAKAKTVSAAATVASDDGGPRLSVQEMLAAVRPGAPSATIAAPAAPVKPAGPPLMPTRPVPAAKAKKGAAADGSRRMVLVALLLSPFVLAWTLLAGTSVIALLATARFMMPNVLIEPPRKFKIGPASDYDLGTVATKLVAQFGVWIVHTDQYRGKNLIYALASVCTHLGCTPSWLAGEQKFKCPCHGSGFYITGINFEGPAPRPLERVGIRLSEDGMLEVDKSIKFQEEMGQWIDPASYYEVVG